MLRAHVVLTKNIKTRAPKVMSSDEWTQEHRFKVVLIEKQHLDQKNQKLIKNEQSTKEILVQSINYRL